MALTELACRTAKAKEKAYKLFDGKGLYLLVQTNGSKLWRKDYRFAGKYKTLSFGPYPEISLADARRKRDDAIRHLHDGADPGELKKATKEAEAAEKPGVDLTFKAVAKENHAIWSDGKDQAHITRVWSRLERDAFPEIGHKLVTEIEPLDIINMVRKVEARGAIDISKRLKQKCGEVFGYAIAMGYCKTDPTAHVNKALRPKPKVQHMPKVKKDEIPDLVVAIDGYGGDEVTRLALKFTLLTAARTGEVRFATWDEIDTKARLWRIPGSRMKMGRDHIVPLADQAIDILRALEPHKREKYLFPARRRSTMNENTMLYALYDIGYRDRQTVHGFRGLFSTVLNESALFQKDWIEKQLAHEEENEIRGAYNAAEYLDHRTPMMQWWADWLYPQVNFEDMLGTAA